MKTVSNRPTRCPCPSGTMLIEASLVAALLLAVKAMGTTCRSGGTYLWTSGIPAISASDRSCDVAGPDAVITRIPAASDTKDW